MAEWTVSPESGDREDCSAETPTDVGYSYSLEPRHGIGNQQRPGLFQTVSVQILHVRRCQSDSFRSIMGLRQVKKEFDCANAFNLVEALVIWM